MSEKVIKSESELYNQIVEMLSSGNFLQLNGKAISLTELNEYINAKQEEIERLKDLCNKYEEEHKTTFEEWKKAITIIKEIREYIEENMSYIEKGKLEYIPSGEDILKIIDKE